MIYTIGHKDSYLAAIAEHGVIEKSGRSETYPGGYAFRTAEDAQRRIDEAHVCEGLAVFGLEADWETDTVQSAEGWWHDLLRDAVIVVLDEA